MISHKTHTLERAQLCSPAALPWLFLSAPCISLIHHMVQQLLGDGILEGGHVAQASHCFWIAKPSGAARFIMDNSLQHASH